MSITNISNDQFPFSMDGLSQISTDSLTIGGVPITSGAYVPYSNPTGDVNINPYNLTTNNINCGVMDVTGFFVYFGTPNFCDIYVSTAMNFIAGQTYTIYNSSIAGMNTTYTCSVNMTNSIFFHSTSNPTGLGIGQYFPTGGLLRIASGGVVKSYSVSTNTLSIGNTITTSSDLYLNLLDNTKLLYIYGGASLFGTFDNLGLNLLNLQLRTNTINSQNTQNLTINSLGSGTQLNFNVNSANIATITSAGINGTLNGSVYTNLVQNLSATSPLVLRFASPTYPLNIYQGATLYARFSQYGLQVDTIGTLSGSSALYLNSVSNDINFQYAGTTYMTAKLANASFYQLISTTGLSLNAGGSAGNVNIASSGAGYNINFYPNGGYAGSITTSGATFPVNGNHFGNYIPINNQSVAMEGQNGSSWIGGCFGGSGHSDRIVAGGLSGVGPTIGAHNYNLTAWANMAVSNPVNVYLSDERVKENIIDATHSLCYETIKKIRLVRFNYKKGGHADGLIGRDKNITGVIAQEFAKVFPKSIYDIPVPNSEETIKSINLDQMNYTLLGAVKELMSITEHQQAKIEFLQNESLLFRNNTEKQLATINNQIARLLSKIDLLENK